MIMERVVLEEFCIYTFKTDTNIISQATEIIDLHTALYIKPLNDIEPNTSKLPSDLLFCFEIYCNNVTFIFNAESKKGMNLWIKYIEQQLFKTYLNTNSDLDTINTMAHNKLNEKLWVCNICAYQNSLKSNICKLCGNNKPTQSKQLKIVKRSAQPRESVVNLADIVNVASDDDKPSSPKSPRSPRSSSNKNGINKKKNIKKVERWQCKICTYENVPALPYCEICGTKKPKIEQNRIIKNMSADELSQEIKDNKCTFNHINCPCINRIVSILAFYQKWLLYKSNDKNGDNNNDNNDNSSPLINRQAFDLAVYQKEIYGNDGPLLRLQAEKTNIMTENDLYKLGIYDFINFTLDNYSNILLLNDFNHILQFHCNYQQIEGITENIVTKFVSDDTQCNLKTCLCIKRNHRNKSSLKNNRNELYFINNDYYDNNDEKNDGLQVVTQQILDRIHCRLVHSFQIYQFRISEDKIIRNTHINGNNILHLDHNRLKTVKDIMKSKKKNLKLIRGENRMKESKYTTQISLQNKTLKRQSSIEVDDIMNANNNNNTNKHNNDDQEDDVTMNFGKRCFYWKFYASKKWYILKKYDNLKDELLNNILGKISKIQYDDLYESCKLLSRSSKCKQLKALEKNIESFKYYDINKNDLFKIDHIMAICLYCNFDILTNRFVTTFSTNTDDIDKFKKIHREMANWSRLMREICECYGTELNSKNRTFFYHGISNKQLLFGETIRFFKPTSCSSKLSVSLQFIDNNHGLILQIEPNPNVIHNIYYFAKTAIFSDFPDEFESIFCGSGGKSLKISSILNIKLSQNYKVYLDAISIFNNIIIGQIPINGKLTKSIIIALTKLINNESKSNVDNDDDDKKSNDYDNKHTLVPKYISNLFHFIVYSTNHKIMIKSDDLNKYNKIICGLLIDLNEYWVKLNLLISLFPNVKTIWIDGKKINVNETTMIKLFTFCENISLQKTKYKTIKLTEIVIVDVQFKINLNDKTYLQQIKNLWTPLKWNITLDFNHKYSKGIRLWR